MVSAVLISGLLAPWFRLPLRKILRLLAVPASTRIVPRMFVCLLVPFRRWHYRSFWAV